eukprot:gnl/TRDRNA2_/TRDRNA2_126588_c0_seq2.p1 gnl/TRDRNA2_/TRDRNA2_126588_c0~~gnl/TRDRNA2_/TRDRNA2_126588_c0_seq2.p1  ORF type:complete len:177 (+),score=15.58 gnl/TRDRNA2_/TRDRNA2_126588_c0_seq2:23-553(+)
MTQHGACYGTGAGYWDQRYTADPEPFEWLETYSTLKSVLSELIAGNTECEILHVGCGNSMLSEAIYDKGFRRIVNIDISKVVVDLMAKRNAQRSGMSWLVMDATQMTFPSGSFDLVLDKGVIDTFACAENWASMIDSYIDEVARVLRLAGVSLKRARFLLPRAWRRFPMCISGFSR